MTRRRPTSLRVTSVCGSYDLFAPRPRVIVRALRVSPLGTTLSRTEIQEQTAGNSAARPRVSLEFPVISIDVAIRSRGDFLRGLDRCGSHVTQEIILAVERDLKPRLNGHAFCSKALFGSGAMLLDVPRPFVND